MLGLGVKILNTDMRGEEGGKEVGENLSVETRRRCVACRALLPPDHSGPPHAPQQRAHMGLGVDRGPKECLNSLTENQV